MKFKSSLVFINCVVYYYFNNKEKEYEDESNCIV